MTRSARPALLAATLLAAAAPCLAQETFEPNPSLSRLSADDAFVRESARSFAAARLRLAGALKIDAEGRLLVAGVDEVGAQPTKYGTTYVPRVVRLLADGRLDPSFGDAGVAVLPLWEEGPGQVRLWLETDPQGRIVVTGEFSAPGTAPFDGGTIGAARLTKDGALDLSFSQDGLLQLDSPTLHVTGLRAVHAAGADGAVIAAVERYSVPYSPYGLAEGGLVRVASDGTIDAAFADAGFVWFGHDALRGFAVDGDGRVVASLEPHPILPVWPPTFGVQRFDATGALDTTWGVGGRLARADGRRLVAADVIVDRLGRIVLRRDDGNIERRFADGEPDLSFSSDGVATPLATGFDGVPRGGRDVFAAAAGADRYVLAGRLMYADGARRRAADGIGVQAIDGSRPGAIAAYAKRQPLYLFERVAALGVAPGGEAAYVLTADVDPQVLRVALTGGKPLPLPDLSVKWVGQVRSYDLGGGRFRVTGTIRIRNASRRDVAAARVFLGFGDGALDIPLTPDPSSSGADTIPLAVRARSVVVRKFKWEGDFGPEDFPGTTVRASVSCELPDVKFEDNAADSRPLTPVWRPE